MSLGLVVLCLMMPVFLILLAQKYAWLDKIGLVVLAFASGIVFAVFDLGKLFFGAVDAIPVQTQLTEISIALAIPLLVFSMDIRQSIQQAGMASLSMLFAVITVVGFAIALTPLFQNEVSEIWQVAGMAVGAYTGGGPNMAAIKVAIEGDQQIFVTMTTYDILLSSIYLLFVMTLAKPMFSLFLSRGSSFQKMTHSDDFEHLADETAHGYKSIIEVGKRRQSMLALLVAAVIVGLSVFIASLLPETLSASATIIAITSLGVLASLSDRVRNLKVSFHIGMYLVLVFCFTMGSMTNVDQLKDLNFALFAYIGLIMVGSLCIHSVLCRVFKIDVDTFLIASAAAIMSVPFIPVIAGALKNKNLIVPGFAISILGYVLGNYLGIFTALSLKSWL